MAHKNGQRWRKITLSKFSPCGNREALTLTINFSFSWKGKRSLFIHTTVLWKMYESESETQSCPALYDPMNYTVHGILQARILESVTFPFSGGSSQPRDQSQVSCIASRFFTSWTIREAQGYWSGQPILSPVDFPDPGIKSGPPALQADSLPTELSERYIKRVQQSNRLSGFPGSPVVKILCFHCWGSRFNSWLGN